MAVVLAALLLGFPVAAEQIAGGTAVIRGRVIAADTGEPIHGAIIRVGPSNRVVFDEDTDMGSERGQRTDDRGVFEISGLAGGRYLLVAFPPGDRAMYLQSDRLPSGSPAIFELRDGDVLTGVDFALPRASAISGRVVDAYGRPLAGMAVSVFQRSLLGTLTRVQIPWAVNLSDDHGRYRAWGLRPGTYYVRVDPGTRTAGYPKGPTGETYVRTYYPDATSVSPASAITLRASEDLANVDVRVAWSRTFSLAGVVLGEAGRPAPLTEVRLDFADEPGTLGGRRKVVDLEGRFVFTGLTPGDYALEARATGTPADSPMTAGPSRVTIGGADTYDVTLVLRPGVTLSGVIVTDTGSSPPFAPDGVRVRASATGLAEQALVPRGAGAVRGDWTFELPGIVVPVTLLVQGLPRGWFTRAVMHAGADVTSAPTDFYSVGHADGLRIIVSDRGATLSGMVVDAAGRPASRRNVWLFPEGAIVSRQPGTAPRTALTGDDGRFEMAALPPSRYAAIAADGPVGVAPGDDALAGLAALATWVTLDEQERKEIHLRLVAWPY